MRTGIDETSASCEIDARHDPAILWMNRGDALARSAEAAAWRLAIPAYENAIAIWRVLPRDAIASIRLGAALMNHGGLLHRVYGIARAADALHSFAEAEDCLVSASSTGHPWTRRNLAGTLVNRANLLLDLAEHAAGARTPGGPDEHAEHASKNARRALAIVFPGERTSLIECELALKARRTLCDALGRLVVAAEAFRQDAVAGEASDVVDEALALVRHWQARGSHDFRALTRRFFSFGAQLYQIHQPHHLAEFVREQLGPGCADADDPVLRRIAMEQVAAALRAIGVQPLQSERPFILGDLETERRLETRHMLRSVLTELSREPFKA